VSNYWFHGSKNEKDLQNEDLSFLSTVGGRVTPSIYFGELNAGFEGRIETTNFKDFWSCWSRYGGRPPPTRPTEPF
jgi:hypothetical protein